MPAGGLEPRISSTLSAAITMVSLEFTFHLTKYRLPRFGLSFPTTVFPISARWRFDNSEESHSSHCLKRAWSDSLAGSLPWLAEACEAAEPPRARCAGGMYFCEFVEPLRDRVIGASGELASGLSVFRADMSRTFVDELPGEKKAPVREGTRAFGGEPSLPASSGLAPWSSLSNISSWHILTTPEPMLSRLSCLLSRAVRCETSSETREDLSLAEGSALDGLSETARSWKKDIALAVLPVIITEI